MTVRVMLISPAMNAGLREARFAGDAALDASGVRAARLAAPHVPDADRAVHGPSERCLRTAEALGLRSTEEPALQDWELGRWSGARLDEVSAREPEGVAAWLADPSAAPHGGESLLALCARAGAWLDSLSGEGRVQAVTEPSLVRAAVVHALALPPQAFWRLDVAPLALTELTGRSGRWNLRVGRPLAGGPGERAADRGAP
ncbi:histidine phosphatase family protein [Streptomyces drozdowiczii]|uniref:Histidine phosphatase family protein n=1 Tax=Streptomyces drozdowiczii TaxID=202862 RepID=A0ABY6PML9_9ACTN|nr:histidine phosphatase family protein [Streptomyces drozdowiczii]MCX0247492.1 histidine phosphatase family protein [Streptomyces drozdowiczii]UZK53119.1 histidine phosphatase family protein [Streptomyces drozdowiczii]